MAEPSFYVRANGGWREVASVANQGENGFLVRVGNSWKVVEEGFVRVNNAWKQFWPPEGDAVEPPPTKPPAGTYVLAATALSLPSGSFSGYAEFNTSAYRGWITQIYARVTWATQPVGDANFSMGVNGRPNNRSYRSVANTDYQWDGRTIDHRIDTFNANALTDFNNGAAYGFNLSSQSLYDTIGFRLNNVRLVLEIS